jgi:integration host factor subunit beta
MATVTKKQLIESLAAKRGMKRAVVKVLFKDFLDEVVERLASGDRIEFREFGVFEVRVRAERWAQNPKTMERVYVPPRKCIRFKPGRDLRGRVETVGRGPGGAAPVVVKQTGGKQPAPVAASR